MAAGIASEPSNRKFLAAAMISAERWLIGSGYVVTLAFADRAPPRSTQICCASGVTR